MLEFKCIQSTLLDVPRRQLICCARQCSDLVIETCDLTPSAPWNHRIEEITHRGRAEQEHEKSKGRFCT